MKNLTDILGKYKRTVLKQDDKSVSPMAAKQMKRDIIKDIFEGHEDVTLERIEKDYDEFVTALKNNAFLSNKKDK